MESLLPRSPLSSSFPSCPSSTSPSFSSSCSSSSTPPSFSSSCPSSSTPPSFSSSCPSFSTLPSSTPSSTSCSSSFSSSSSPFSVSSSSLPEAPPVRFPPSRCQFCGSPRVSLVRVASRLRSCRACFIRAFEDDVWAFIRRFSLFHSGQKVAVCVSGGKDSAVLLHVLHTLNVREHLGLSLHLLAVDEGIKGYRDQALAAVKRNSHVYNLPLHIVSYDNLYQGWTMDRIAQQALENGKQPPVASANPSCSAASRSSSPSISRACGCRGNRESAAAASGGAVGPCVDAEEKGQHCGGSKEREEKSGKKDGRSGDFTHSCTFCGIFRRQAFERGAQDIGADVLCTGHNADDGAETFLMNILRGDVQRLPVSGAPLTGSREGPSVMRVKPLLASFQREVVLYAHFNRLDYFATECTYSGAAYRGLVRNFFSSLQDNQQQQRILDLLHAARNLWTPPLACTEENAKGSLGSDRQRGEPGKAEATLTALRGEEGESAEEERDGAVVLRPGETIENPSELNTSEGARQPAVSLGSSYRRETAMSCESPLGEPRLSPNASASSSCLPHSSHGRPVEAASEAETGGSRRRGADDARGDHGGEESVDAKKKSDVLPGRNGELRPCVLCGFLTKKDLCRACALVQALNENKLDFVGMNARKGNKLMRGDGHKKHEKENASRCSEGPRRNETAISKRQDASPMNLARSPGLRGSLAW
ncbi:PP-loop domain protein, related [Neospora caninum Liverpool]|uniref:PP-loop domain protein, related n=1 Tax=Neospora caninum (strain Liverpool) TaxID=572307 RepID=F0VMH5_NEOCL|nr:PP-loop domain protein, related [Neospora caninum Liverpool]CBZ54921.1 PP-loop domain protein, related [Neospora caninum Liverpool]CEL69643.1 TPA: PP-loop domain protein, related [Neospora caninum Liverpool]|eukprot:XP_003884949.1 PP-loop domain protein, related [Neospora caninum Liverpool]